MLGARGKVRAATGHRGGVLDGGQIEGPGLGPGVGDVVEILGIGGDLLKDAPGGFDAGEVLFALILAAVSVQQYVSAPDAFQSAMAEGKLELADEPAGAQSGELLTKCDGVLFQGEGVLPG